MNDPWITTFSGRQFFITRATPDDIYIEDIAHGLSNICRYVGQCKEFYSVAEHAVRMAEMAWSPSMKFLALMHDSPEAYLNDLSSLIKDCLPVYKEMEGYLHNVIFDKYGIKHCPLMNFDADSVKALDGMIRTPEVLSLFTAHDGWHLEDCVYGRIRPWSNKKAERRFLKMFKKLYKEVNDGNSSSKS